MKQNRRPGGLAPQSGSGRLVVACDDGSVWTWHDDRTRWEEMPPIPGSAHAAVEDDRRTAGR
jgi:hypothetical protein